MFTRRAKDIQRCLRSIDSFTEGQARVVNCDYDELKSIQVELVPNEGPYKGGRFIFTIGMSSQFPEVPPDVTCETNIYHPNIDPTTDELNVCLSLFDEWETTFGLEDTIQGLLFLFHEPNLEDPLSPYFSGESYDSFDDDVLKSMKGECVEGVRFDIVLDVTNIGNTADSSVVKSVPKTEDSLNAEIMPVNSFATGSLSLDNAIDIVEIVMEMVCQVSDDNCEANEVAMNAKNEAEKMATENVSANCNIASVIDNDSSETLVNSKETLTGCEVCIGIPADQNCDTEKAEACASNEQKETIVVQVNAQAVKADLEKYKLNEDDKPVGECDSPLTVSQEPSSSGASDSDFDAPRVPVSSESDQENINTIPQELLEDTKTIVPRLDFDDINTIIEKVDNLLATKGEEVDKKEEEENKRLEEMEESDEEEEDVINNNEVRENEDAQNEIQENNSATTTNSLPAVNITEIENSCHNINNNEMHSNQRPDSLNRQISKIEKFDLIFEKISQEHKSTQTDFNMLFGNLSFLQYASPTNTMAFLVNPQLEYSTVILIGSLWKYFISVR